MNGFSIGDKVRVKSTGLVGVIEKFNNRKGHNIWVEFEDPEDSGWFTSYELELAE